MNKTTKILLATVAVMVLVFALSACSLVATDSMNLLGDPEETTNSSGSATTGERMALSSAKNYLRTMGFSKSGLVKQLEFEGYSTDEANYAVENCGADWNEQAVRVAESYLNAMPMSKKELVNQLKYEGFTADEAQYGADQAYQ